MQLSVSQRWVSVVMSKRLGCFAMCVPFMLGRVELLRSCTPLETRPYENIYRKLLSQNKFLSTGPTDLERQIYSVPGRLRAVFACRLRDGHKRGLRWRWCIRGGH